MSYQPKVNSAELRHPHKVKQETNKLAMRPINDEDLKHITGGLPSSQAWDTINKVAAIATLGTSGPQLIGQLKPQKQKQKRE